MNLDGLDHRTVEAGRACARGEIAVGEGRAAE